MSNVASSLVSVIIPNYNHATFLKERIDSVIDQTYSNFEVIILDDKSTDNSKEIIEKYRMNNNVSHIEFNTKNSGSTFTQWGKGLELAKGEWIWIAESDDIAELDFLEKMVETLQKEKSQIAYANSMIIDDKGQASTWYKFKNMPFKEQFKPFQNDFTLASNEFINSWMTTDNFIPNASAVVFSKEIARSIYNENQECLSSFKLMGDWFFWISFLSKAELASYSSNSLNKYRCHDKSVRSEKIKFRTLEFEPIIEAIKKADIDTSKTVSTFLFRYFDREIHSTFTFAERLKVIGICFRQNIFIVYLKTWANRFHKKDK